MDRLRAVLDEIWAFLRRSRTRSELREEFLHHIEMEIEKNLRAGAGPREARRQAYVSFGGEEWFVERTAEVRWAPALDFARDVRIGLRCLLRRRAFTVAAVLTLSVGIGMTAAMFALVETVLLRPLPGANTEGMVYLSLESEDGQIGISPTPELLRLVRDHARSFERVEAYATEDLDVVFGDERVRAKVARASAGFFSFLGVRPERGRTFTTVDGTAAGASVAVLSHELWLERFGGRRDLSGSTVQLGDRLHEVIGVLPTEFRLALPGQARLWVPEGAGGEVFTDGTPVEGALARLEEGVSLDVARDELDALIRSRPLESLAGRSWVGVLRTPRQLVDEELVRAVLILQGGAVLVFLIGCGNLANLLLAQGETRQRELAVRASLGAGRSRLVRQLLTESLVLAVMGGASGSILAMWGLGILPRLLPLEVAAVSPTGSTFAVAVGVALASVLLVGVAPATKATRAGLSTAIKGGGQAGGLATVGPHQMLVTTQVALTVLLLIGAGLLLKSYAGLTSMDMGFDSRELMTVRVDLPEGRDEDVEATSTFLQRIEDGLESLPDQVATATAASGLVENLVGTAASVAAPDEPFDEAPSVKLVWKVLPGYFRVVDQPILQGRDFTRADRNGAEAPVILGGQAAARYFPGQDPVGQRLRVGTGEYVVVGVAGDLRLPSLAKGGVGDLQLFTLLGRRPETGVTIIMRVRGDPATAVDLVRRSIRDADPSAVVHDATMVDEQLSQSLAEDASNTVLMAMFALTALLLGAVGVYGIVAYSVSRRTREMGIRIALGASTRALVSRFFVGGIAPAVVGMVIGAAGGLFLGPILTGLLHQVEPHDPWVFGVVLGMITAVAALSTWIPARRASRLNPVETLRVD